MRPFRVLDIPTVLAGKLAAFFGRQGKNDLLDIEFLIKTYPQQVHQIRTSLNYEHRQRFVVAFANVRTAQETNRVKMVLGVAL